MARERLQKILARAGVASRRAAEKLIVEGKVRVNGRVVRELGTQADGRKDRIEVNGRKVVLEKPAYYVLHKPRAVVSTLRDPEGRTTVRGLIDGIPERVVPVGRLDYHTSGVLLLTNDGELVEALLRPARKVPKTYVVKMKGHLDVEELDRLRRGVELDDGTRTQPAELFVLREEQGHTWVQMTLTEGKNRQIRRMGDAIGRRVMRLSRVAFAEVTVDGLRPGQWRAMSAREVERLTKKWVTPKRKIAEDERPRRQDHDA